MLKLMIVLQVALPPEGGNAFVGLETNEEQIVL